MPKRGALTGSKNPNAKLTAEQVAEIRRRRAEVEPGTWAPKADRYASLAAEFGVAKRTVIAIVTGDAWRSEHREHMQSAFEPVRIFTDDEIPF